MKKKNTKPRPRSRVSRGFKLVDDDDDDDDEHCLNTQDLVHRTHADSSVSMNERIVEETKHGNDPIVVDDGQDDTVVPETQNSYDVDEDNVKDVFLVNKHGEVFIHKENLKSLNSTSVFNLDTLEMLFETEQGVCIRCNKGDGRVLICNGNGNGNGCSTGVHPGCFGFPPTFDDVGNYYCPLCAYKRALSELDEAEKEEALALEKVNMFRNSLSLFRAGSIKKVSTHKKELNQSRVDMDMDMDSDGCRYTRQFSDGLPKDQPKATATTGYGNLWKAASLLSERNDNPLGREGDQANQVGSDQRKSTKDLQESVVAAGCSVRKSCDTSLPRRKRLKQVDDFHHLEISENLKEAIAALRFCNGGREAVTSLISEQNVASGGGHHADEVDRHDASSGGHHADEVDGHLCETVAKVRRKVGPSVSCGNDNACREDVHLPSEFGNPVTPEKANETKLAEEHQQLKEGDQEMQVESSIGSENRNTKTTASANPALPYPRRKILYWTTEEEQMLEEAMKVFSSKIGKMTPWTDILDYGSKVFNESRTPMDLKDKWRNMVKEKEKQKKKEEEKKRYEERKKKKEEQKKKGKEERMDDRFSAT